MGERNIGMLQAACMMLRHYLKSGGYRKARAARTRSWKGRGIAMAAGRAYNLVNAYVMLHMLRNVHKSDLPVEIFFNGVQEFDLDTQQIFQNDFSQVTLMDVSELHLPSHLEWIQKKNLSDLKDGWVTKSLMLFHTSFEELMVLDSDNVPLRDPSYLFDSKEYKSTGSLFWPDYWTSNFQNPGPAYKLFDLDDPWEKNPDTVTTESGQFIIDRSRHDDVLEWVVLLNLHAETVYEMLYGDKDTYRLAFHLAEKPLSFRQISHRPANAIHKPDYALLWTKRVSDKKEPKNEKRGDFPWWYTHAGMIQMGPEGHMMFLHRTSDAKLDPLLIYPDGYESTQWMTVPLSSRQAQVVHMSGGMDTNKFDTEAGRKCRRGKGLAMTQMVMACGLMDFGTGEDPGLIPLLNIDQFPALRLQLNQTMRAFKHVQELYLTEQVPFGAPVKKKQVTLSRGSKVVQLESG